MKTARQMTNYCIENGWHFSGGEGVYQHFEVVERNLSPDEDVVFAYVSNGVKDRRGDWIVGGHTAIVFTTKKMMYAQRRKIMGDFVKTVNYDNINDISSKIGWLFGDIVIDSLTEYMDLSVDKVKVEEIRKLSLEAIDSYRAKKNSANGQIQALSAADELKKFKELLDMGIITQEEFDAKKKQLLGL